jgi:hypothetical protein
MRGNPENPPGWRTQVRQPDSWVLLSAFSRTYRHVEFVDRELQQIRFATQRDELLVEAPGATGPGAEDVLQIFSVEEETYHCRA